MQTDDSSDNDQRRRSDAGFCNPGRQRREVCRDDPLSCGAAVLDHGSRMRAMQAVRHHLAAYFLDAADSHIEDRSSTGARQGLPIQVDATILEMAGGEAYGLRVIAVGERYSRVGGTPAAAVTPGTTSKGMPHSNSVSISSPPRPKMKGSPPLRRTTIFPREPVVPVIC